MIDKYDDIQDDPPTVRPKAPPLAPDVAMRKRWGLVLCNKCGCHYTTPCPLHGMPPGESFPDGYWRKS